MTIMLKSRSWTSRPLQSRVSQMHRYQWWYRTAINLLKLINKIRTTLAASASMKLMLAKSNWMKSTLRGNYTQLSQHMIPPAIKKTGRSLHPAKWLSRTTTTVKNNQNLLNSRCDFWALSNSQVKALEHQCLQICSYNPKVVNHR